MEPKEGFQLNCPVPLPPGQTILMAHGGGGKTMNDLIEKVFRSAFSKADAPPPHDSAVLTPPKGRLAFTTDGYVVKPLFFPGGDIGTLAVNGTLNDLAMSGARPLALSCAFILEEGLEVATLQRVVDSMADSAAAAGVPIVTGDTKVVDRGKGDQVFVTTAGVGVCEHDLPIGPASVKPGDAVLVSGDLGRHGTAILAVREGLSFETSVSSDCAYLYPAVKALLDAGVEVHCLRDLTRGGLASALNEIAKDSGLSVKLEGSSVPVSGPVASACEILGLDPLYVANEGRFAAWVAAPHAERALEALRSVPVSSGAVRIGTVGAGDGSAAPLVLLRTALGPERILDMLSGEQMPRIC